MDLDEKLVPLTSAPTKRRAPINLDSIVGTCVTGAVSRQVMPGYL